MPKAFALFSLQVPALLFPRLPKDTFCSSQKGLQDHGKIDGGNARTHDNDGKLVELGMTQFVVTYDALPTIQQGKHLYEEALDKYITVYEKIRGPDKQPSMPVLVPVHSGVIPLRSRIPFLLAALGHDDLAVRETELCMFRWSAGPRNDDINQYTDLIRRGMQQQQRLMFTSWPKCFLLPVLLVKMRLVAGMRQELERLNCFFSETHSGEQLGAVESMIREQLVLAPDFLTNRTEQMEFLFDLMSRKNRPPLESFFDFHDPDPYGSEDDEANCYVEEIFVELQGEMYDFLALRVYECLLVRDCFQQDSIVHNLITGSSPIFHVIVLGA